MVKHFIWLVTLLAGFGSGFAQVSGAWQNSSNISINTSGIGVTGTRTNYPLLVRLTSTNFDFDLAKDDGTDIRFTNIANTTSYDYELERYDKTNQVAEFWVMIPSIPSNTTTDFTMHYGNPAATDASDGEAVFLTGGSSGFQGVWHLAENGNNNLDNYKDATLNANHGQGTSMSTASDVDAAIGIGQNFDGTADNIVVDDANSLDMTNIFTISCWVNVDVGATGWQGFVGKNRSAENGYWLILDQGGNQMFFEFHDVGTGGNAFRKAVGGWAAGEHGNWIYYAGTYDGSNIILYRNGVEEVTTAYAGTALAHTANLVMGGDGSQYQGFLNGKLDEVRVADVPHSANWIKLDYETQRPGANRLTITENLPSNNVPTAIQLSSSTISAGEPTGTLVGNLTTTDDDVGDTHTYSFVTGTGSTNNTSFSIISGQLLTAETPGLPEGSYTVRIQTDDGNGGTFAQAFPITVTAVIIPPSNLAYTGGNSMIFPSGTAIVEKILTYDDGPASSLAIAPALPAGLLFNTTNGTISGTPTTPSAQQTFTVTAQPGGATVNISVTVTDGAGPPLNLEYSSGSPVTWYINLPIDTNFFTYDGAVATSITPHTVMPPGLTFDLATGNISGTPQGPAGTTEIYVTVTNSVGSAIDTLVINIIATPPAPTCQGYDNSDLRFLLDSLIEPKEFAHTGTEISDISILPTLPAGLAFDSAGTISGTPTATDTSTYVVTVTNLGGACADTFNLRVMDLSSLSAPGIDSVTSINPDGPYDLGEVITITLHFNFRTTLDSGTMIVVFETGEADHSATIPAITDQDSVTFTYTVLNGDRTDRLMIKSITLSDSNTTFVDEFGRAVGLLLDTPENLSARHKIELIAADASLSIDTIAQGGNDTVLVGDAGEITLIVPAIPTLPTLELFTLDLYENIDNRPGDEVGPITVWRDVNGNPLTFETPVTIRLQIETTKLAAAGGTLEDVYIYIAPEVEGGDWIRIEPAVLEGTELVYTTNSLNITMVGLDRELPEVTVDSLPPAATAGTPLVINFTYHDNAANPHLKVIVHSDSAGLPQAELPATGGTATIPAEYVNPLGLWYVVEINDGPNTVLSDTVDIVMLVPDARVATKTVIEGSYQMVSIPLNPVDKTVQTLFIDDYGEPNIKRWRMFNYTGAEFESMIPSSLVEVGRAYWLMVQGDPLTVSTAPSQLNSIPVSKPYSIRVHENWNTISNPFLRPVLSTSIETGGKPLLLYDLSDSGWIPDTLVAEPLQLVPWKGYVFKNPNSGDVGHIHPDSFAVRPEFVLPAVPLAKRKPSGEVVIKMYVKQGNVTDGLLMMGYNYPGSKSTRDSRDHVKPGMGNLYFKTFLDLPGEQNQGIEWLSDIRGEINNGFTWNFNVSHTGQGPLSLNLSGMHDVSTEHRVWLLDKVRNEVVALDGGNTASYTFTSQGSGNEPFELVVGTEEYLENRMELYTGTSDFNLRQNYPNPFRGNTVIEYSVPGARELNLLGSTVSLKIYNTRGKLVKTLLNRAKQLPGSYSITWDAVNNSGHHVPAGLYIYRLQVNGSHSQKRLMTFLR